MARESLSCRNILLRCYWEVGGEHRENRSYCFNWLLKAAKLDPSSAEVGGGCTSAFTYVDLASAPLFSSCRRTRTNPIPPAGTPEPMTPCVRPLLGAIVFACVPMTTREQQLLCCKVPRNQILCLLDWL